jgi:hypothetical protein
MTNTRPIQLYFLDSEIRLTAKDIIDEGCEKLQVMAMTVSVSPPPVQDTTSYHTSEAYSGCPTEYTSIPANDDHSSKSPKGLDIEQ